MNDDAPDPRLYVYRLIHADVAILEQIARFIVNAGECSQRERNGMAEKLNLLIERAKANPYTER